MQVTIYILEIIIGAAFLAWGADRFIYASVSLAKHLKLSTLVIGVVLVGFGTSFPELIVSIFASLHGSSEIAIGNVVGSNIANIGLVLGLAALITPITVNSRLIKREMPVLIAISLVLGLIFWGFHLSRLEGMLLILLLALHLYWMLIRKPSKNDSVFEQFEKEVKTHLNKKPAIIWWFVGLIILLISSEIFVTGAVGIARWFKISELIIGLTIVTIGTSLPELAATITSVLRKEHDVAFGHVIGSNIFNSLAVLAMPALISPGPISPAIIHRDYPVMLAYTCLLWVALYCFKKKKVIGRIFGGILLLGYISYLITLAVT